LLEGSHAAHLVDVLVRGVLNKLVAVVHDPGFLRFLVQEALLIFLAVLLAEVAVQRVVAMLVVLARVPTNPLIMDPLRPIHTAKPRKLPEKGQVPRSQP
jgi:hypothetical protein